MKLRTLILTLAAIAVAASSLSGCVIVPARGYAVAPPVTVNFPFQEFIKETCS